MKRDSTKKHYRSAGRSVHRKHTGSSIYFISTRSLLANALLVFLLISSSTHLFGNETRRSLAYAAQRVISTSPIQHVIIIEKKSRTFDNYFGTFPNANGATTYTDSSGNIHPLGHQADSSPNLNHSGAQQVKSIDGGKMDRFAKGALTQFYQSDIPNYWNYAQTFTLADNFFSMAKSPAFPNQLFLIAAQNADAFENPLKADGSIPSRYGCDSSQGTTVKEWHADGSYTYEFPCFDFQTMGDTLNTYGISWKFYAPGSGSSGYIWSSYDAINHIRNTSQWKEHVVAYTKFASDATSGNLPTVSWLTEPQEYSDHQPYSVCVAENWLVSQINAVMQNPALWYNTAIIVTWDDWGGFYDHVNPPAGPTNANLQYGLRAPVLIISPYANAGTVDHTLYSFPSVLKFIETTFNLPALGTLDSQANDLSIAFNFSQQPLSPLILQQRTCGTTLAP
jgi:phospholipase C